MKPVLFLDLDGVLCDFLGGICQAHGRAGYLPTTWDFYRDEWGMAARDFWMPADDPDFWASLDWTPEGQAILAACEAAVGAEQVYILTSGRAAPAAAGKTVWVKRELGRDYLDRLIIAHHKQLCAGPGRVLVDDADHNVDAFEGAGGCAVLVPRAWNRLGAGDAVEAVRAGLDAARLLVGNEQVWPAPAPQDVVALTAD